jgi:DNA polymerase III subunit beta
MVATDGHRLSLVRKGGQFEGVEEEIRALVPRKTLLEILKLIGDQELLVGFARDENHLFFSVGNRRLVSRVLAGQFPNYEMVIPRENDKSVTASTRVLMEAIRRAAVMSDEKLKAVRFSATPGSLELSASSADAGEAREVVPVEYEGARVDIGFNPQYLLDFLGVCGSETVVMALRDGDTQGMMAPSAGSEIDYQYVVMPMKF